MVVRSSALDSSCARSWKLVLQNAYGWQPHRGNCSVKFDGLRWRGPVSGFNPLRWQIHRYIINTCGHPAWSYQGNIVKIICHDLSKALPKLGMSAPSAMPSTILSIANFQSMIAFQSATNHSVSQFDNLGSTSCGICKQR